MSLLRLSVLFFAVAASAFCETIVLEEIIAKINGDVILRSDYDSLLGQIRQEVQGDGNIPAAQKDQAFAAREKNALSDLIDERLLIQTGKNDNINVEADVLRQRDAFMREYNLATVEDFERWAPQTTGMSAEDLLERVRDRMLTQAVLGQNVASRITVPREDIQKYYDEHHDEFIRSEGVRLSEILISTENATTPEEKAAAETKAKDVLARVQRGELFDEMARRFSDSEASKERGGDIGIFRRGMLQKEIEDKVFDANPGFITDLIPVQRGYLILKVVQRYREGLAELSEVEDEIHNKLAGPKYAPAIREYLAGLREDAYIEIRPGYIDSNAVEGKDTSWSDPAKLAPVTTTREELLNAKKKRKLLWLIPIGTKKGSSGGAPADQTSSIGQSLQ